MKKPIYWLALSAALAVSTSLQASEKVDLSARPVNLNNSKSDSVENAIHKQLRLTKKNHFGLLSTSIDAKGNKHNRYQQFYAGIPVWGQQVLTHQVNADNRTRLSGHYLNNIDANTSKNTSIKTTQAVIEHAKLNVTKEYGKLKQIRKEQANQVIYRDEKSGKTVLAYHVELYAINELNTPVRRMSIIDANTGFVYQDWNALMQIDITGPGGNDKTGRYDYGVDYPALQGTDSGAGLCTLENDNVRAVNLNNSADNSDNTAFEFACTENTFHPVNGAFSPINDAFFFGNLAFELYDNWYNVKPLNTQLSMKVHFDNQNQTAFWDGQAMTFGDGGDDYYPLVGVNISVHEISHGFTQLNSGLLYQGQSGAINEAFSDIAGEAAEFYWKGQVDWAVSANILKNSDGLRFFDKPTKDNISIDHLDDYVANIDVHHASGIYNHAFYLLATTSNWDVRKAFDVFVTANQSYWLPDATFESAACGLFMAASDLQYEWLDVYKALSAVGVYCQGNAIDEDNDDMSDITEMVYGFDPTKAEDANTDFDADGLSNLVEISSNFNPKDRDTDNDGLTDSAELDQHATSVINNDTDNDGMLDGWELANSLDPLVDTDAYEDLDSDGILNLQEFKDNTNPTDANSFVSKIAPHNGIYDLEDEQLIPGTNIASGATANFIIGSTKTPSGSFSLVSNDIDDQQQTAMEWVVNLSLDGQLYFDIKTSTEKNKDIFNLIVDSEIVYSLSGEQQWQNVSIPLTAGTHTVIFSYQKNDAYSIGEDLVWLDNLSYTGLLFDTDGDQMNNAWETFYQFNPERAHDATGDPDEDGLTNLQEFNAYTSPLVADSDLDNLSDFDEINTHLTDPNNADSDLDGINDGLEISLTLSPLDAADGLLDLDSDGINNQTEAKYQTALNDAQHIPELLGYLSNDFSESLSDNWDLSSTDSWLIENKSSDSDADKQLFAEPIGNNSLAEVSYLNVFETGTLTFTVNIDSEPNDDQLHIYLDNTLVSSMSGQKNEQVTIELSRGEHLIRWSYSKNIALSTSLDRVSIDDLLFIAPTADSDNDGLTNAEELTLGTKLDKADTDGDGLTDGQEVEMGTDPKLEDTDGDGVSDFKDAYPNDSTRWDESGRWNDDSGGGSLLILLSFIALLNTRKIFI